MGDFEAVALAIVESSLKYHPCVLFNLTLISYPDQRQRLVGSLTGAVASERVTEARNGWLRLIGNQPTSVKA